MKDDGFFSKQTTTSPVQNSENTTTANVIDMENLKKYFHGLNYYDWWRVLADAKDQAIRNDDGILVYDTDEEPGYMLDILTAFFESFVHANEPLSLDLLKNLHKKATQSRKLNLSGEFRLENETFGCFTSPEGRKEIEKYLKEKDDFSYDAKVDAAAKPNFKGLTPDKGIHKRVQEVIDSYENSCKKDFSIHELVTMIQTLIRIHPFLDGNCRVICMLLLNKELIRHNQCPTILSDYSQFAGFSQSEMIIRIEHGQKRAKDIAAQNDKEIFFHPSLVTSDQDTLNSEFEKKPRSFVKRSIDLYTRLIAAAFMHRALEQLNNPALKPLMEALVTERNALLPEKSECIEEILLEFIKKAEKCLHNTEFVVPWILDGYRDNTENMKINLATKAAEYYTLLLLDLEQKMKIRATYDKLGTNPSEIKISLQEYLEVLRTVLPSQTTAEEDQLRLDQLKVTLGSMKGFTTATFKSLMFPDQTAKTKNEAADTTTQKEACNTEQQSTDYKP